MNWNTWNLQTGLYKYTFLALSGKPALFEGCDSTAFQLNINMLIKNHAGTLCIIPKGQGVTFTVIIITYFSYSFILFVHSFFKTNPLRYELI